MSHRLLEISHCTRSKRNFNLFSPEAEIEGYRHFCFVFHLFYTVTPSSHFLFLHFLKALAQKQKCKSAASLVRQLQRLRMENYLALPVKLFVQKTEFIGNYSKLLFPRNCLYRFLLRGIVPRGITEESLFSPMIMCDTSKEE